MGIAQGYVAPGFEAVRDEFARNLRFRGDGGAAFTAYQGGRTLVDLWGGPADRATGRPWVHDTPVVVFSCTKGMTAVCLLILLDRGVLELDAPVARYWPEFGAGGKEAITIGDVMSHQARLPAFDVPVGVEELRDDVALSAQLASQAPEPSPAAARVYHVFAYGYLCAGLVRRVDGRSLGRFFAEEVADPLGLEAWIGAPPELEARLAVLSRRDDYGAMYESFSLRETSDYVDVVRRAHANPDIGPAPDEWFNLPELHAAEIPAVGGIATAPSLARMYACLAAGGELDGVRLLSPETIALARAPRAEWHDEVFNTDVRFGLGFELHPPARAFGIPELPYGHQGLGGSVGAVWPTARVGYAYVTNRLSDQQPDRRATALLRALDVCLGVGPPPRLARRLGDRACRSWSAQAPRAALTGQLVRNQVFHRLSRIR